MKSQIIKKDNYLILYGKTDANQLYFDFPEWRPIATQYKPDMENKRKIEQFKEHVKVLVFLGTWCGDSRRNVPPFLSLIENNSQIVTELWATDINKRLDNNFHKTYNIKRVPTFIFFHKNKEVGRIIERPRTSMEEDMVKILEKIGQE